MEMMASSLRIRSIEIFLFSPCLWVAVRAFAAVSCAHSERERIIVIGGILIVNRGFCGRTEGAGFYGHFIDL